MNFSERYDKASRLIRKNGIKVLRNVKGCCRSCLWSEVAPKDEPIIWHYGGQGGSVDLEDFDVFYLSHDGITPERWSVISMAFKMYDIPFKWSGDEYKCIEIYAQEPVK